MYIKRILLAIVFIGLLGGGAFAYMVYKAFFLPNTAFSNAEAYVYIPSNTDFPALLERLAPLLEDTDAFAAVAKRKQYVSNIKGGKYVIQKGMNNNQIVNSLRSNNIPVQVSFNNQETVADLAGRVAQQLEADSLSLQAAMMNDAFLAENGADKTSNLSLFVPNSYEFFWNTSAEEFTARMSKEYQRFWNADRRQKAKSLQLTPFEVSTLAAIVHKETAKVDERPRVAGVYLNRLRKGMRLQADPTVIYAIKTSYNNFDTIIKRVLYRDLELDSPYNTYKYSGLPPGPITMPDISAVDAVLNAEKHEYYYFVANVEQFGYHKFAKTLVQHNRNKAQYIRWINNQKIRR